MTDKERMEKGLLYIPMDKEIMDYQLKCLDVLFEYNNTKPSEQEKRSKLLKDMFAEIGEGCYFEAPLYSNFGCKHVHVGKYVYGNFGLTLVDDSNIYIGDYVLIAPKVVIATASHPINSILREKGYQFNRDVHIGNNVWIGAGAIILPGVTIGDNTVIGAGSVVTKDIPSNVVAVGNPCKVLREVSEKDRIYYYKNDKIDWENIKL